jgi:ABC-type nitrate/sulfonate/bicarbonate transport system substrate-binding protein
MFKFLKCFAGAFILLTPSILAAQAGPTGSVAGSADPGAQIIVTGADSGSVIGIVAACDGTFRAEGLKPGRYAIVEGGPHHATRKLSVAGGEVSHVDLGAPTPESTRACADKSKR